MKPAPMLVSVVIIQQYPSARTRHSTTPTTPSQNADLHRSQRAASVTTTDPTAAAPRVSQVYTLAWTQSVSSKGIIGCTMSRMNGRTISSTASRAHRTLVIPG